MTKTTKTSLALITIMLAVLAGYTVGHQMNQAMWEQAVLSGLR
tara:strand:- start:1036 stop:1164 length:129 start_codon:yes stop_codon:yes gene_type:complete